ncbi:MAG TPA: hypothetical protein VEC11_11130 [Allosphingosinicella sp.]|nr:hypothetical protein [Allosphingosinicella sp.]
MRLFLSIPLAVGAIVALGACGQNEQALRNTFRTAALTGCQNGDPAGRAQLQQAGIDPNRYCTCAIDRYMQSATLEQIKADSRDPNSSAALRGAAMQCASELMQQSGAAAAAAAGANASEAAAPAEAPAAAEGGEAAAGNEAGE